jgi:methylaspartate ammonia-lyase
MDLLEASYHALSHTKESWFSDVAAAVIGLCSALGSSGPGQRHGLFERQQTLDHSKGERTMAKVQKSTDSSSLAEVVDRILDKGIVIDAWAKVSLVGIELLSVEARVVIASVETYLKYAEAIGLTASAAAPA